MAERYDVIVIGGDPASLCAAGAAASAGLRAALLYDPERTPPEASIPAIPNALWRRMNLQNYGLQLAPVTRAVRIDAAGVRREICLDMAQAEHRLRSAGDGGDLELAALVGAYIDGGELAAPETASFIEAARDFGVSDTLAADLGAYALCLAGAGGREPGSSALIAELAAPGAGRLRPLVGGAPLAESLRSACRDINVDVRAVGVDLAIGADDDWATAAFGDETFRARRIFFAHPAAARAYAAEMYNAGSPTQFARAAGAVLTVRLKGASDAFDPDAVYISVDGVDAISAARDSVVTGRMPDAPPVVIEAESDRTIVVRTDYVPAALRDDGVWRAWTQQDRQAAARLLRERLTAAAPGLAELIDQSHFSLTGDNDGAAVRSERIVVQPRRLDCIAASLAMIDAWSGHD